MFWADKIAQEVIKEKKAPFKVFDWWTPSGMAHAGHIRTFILHQIIYEAIQANGGSVEYFYGFDDMDPLDGLTEDLVKDFEQYMGQPLFTVPSPVAGYENYADYFEKQYLSVIEKLDIKPKNPRTSEMYRDGKFNKAIKLVLDKADIIRDIYKDLGAERPKDWLAFQPICQKCHKLGTTRAYAWDGKEVSYVCEQNLVKWAKGCGYEGKVSPFDGNGKMQWKVEWPATWFVMGTSYEGGGKDHFTKNGSRDYARMIAKRVFEIDEPIGYPHEFFTIGGAKMSSSKGLGAKANEVVDYIPPVLIRFLITRIPPHRHLEFDPQGDTIPHLFDDFDTNLREYWQKKDSDTGKIISYSYSDEKEIPKFTLKFSKVSFLIQMPHINIYEQAEKEKGSKLDKNELANLDQRIKFAKPWLESFADEKEKFILQKTMPKVDLSPDQKQYLMQLLEELVSVDWEGEKLHEICHKVKNKINIAPKNAFSAIYRIFLAKDFGPQAGWALAALDKEFVLNRIKEAIK